MLLVTETVWRVVMHGKQQNIQHGDLQDLIYIYGNYCLHDSSNRNLICGYVRCYCDVYSTVNRFLTAFRSRYSTCSSNFATSSKITEVSWLMIHLIFMTSLTYPKAVSVHEKPISYSVLFNSLLLLYIIYFFLFITKAFLFFISYNILDYNPMSMLHR